MNRKLIAFNLALAVAAGLLVWQLKARREQAALEEKAVLAKRGRAQAILAPPAPAPVPTVAPAQYNDTVQNMLFAKDRNPNVIVEVQPPPAPPPPPPPMPALPYYYGQLRFGGPAVIELRGANGKEPQKGYEAGQKIGDFTVVGFDRETVTLEWNGQELVRDLADLKPKEAEGQPQPAARPAAPSPAAPGNSSGVISINSSSDPATAPALGPDVGGGYYGCQPGDTSPSGTIANGYQKTSTQGLMGFTCRWEKVK